MHSIASARWQQELSAAHMAGVGGGGWWWVRDRRTGYTCKDCHLDNGCWVLTMNGIVVGVL